MHDMQYIENQSFSSRFSQDRLILKFGQTVFPPFLYYLMSSILRSPLGSRSVKTFNHSYMKFTELYYSLEERLLYLLQ